MSATPFSGESPQSIPQQRIIEKLDSYMAQRDYAGAERHLLYWVAEAQALGDKRGELVVRNELVGHFRKTGNGAQALAHAEAALALLDELGFEGTISAGTTYTNAATACNAFGKNERALELFEKALRVYESSDGTPARLLGGLCNNMALACIALGRFDEADALYRKALDTMAQVENGELEQAITYLNMADAAVARAKAETMQDGADPELAACESCAAVTDACIEKARELLDTPAIPRDGYYAFVCEKCAPTFAYYGYFLDEGELRERARRIYEGA